MSHPRMASAVATELLCSHVMNSRRLLVAALMAISLAIPALADAQSHNKIDRALLDALAQGGSSAQPVIVTLRRGARAELRDALRRHGDRIKYEHDLIDALSVDLTAENISELAGLPDVTSISL